MFSGIVESTSQILKSETTDQVQRIWVKRPHFFDDLKIGDSVCTNGVCLTVEALMVLDSENVIQFCLGLETLTLLQKSLVHWNNYSLNLERSMKLGDRLHGHLVTGHVDAPSKIVFSHQQGEVWMLGVEIPSTLKTHFWKKGSACVNGVSLTVNDVNNNCLSFCLIPETLKVTNLSQYKVGEYLNLESDYLAKAYIHSRQSEEKG